MRSLFKNKRGNWVDIIEYIGTAIGLGIVLFFMSWFLISFTSTLTDVKNSTTNLIPDESLNIATTASTEYPPSFDYILPVIYIFFLVFSVWSARQIQSSYLLVWIYPLIAIVLIFLSLIAESAWEQFVNNPVFVGVSDIFVVTNFFLSYLRFFIFVYSILVGWALYAKDE